MSVPLLRRRFGYRLPKRDVTQKLTAKQLKAGRPAGSRCALVPGDAGLHTRVTLPRQEREVHGDRSRRPTWCHPRSRSPSEYCALTARQPTRGNTAMLSKAFSPPGGANGGGEQWIGRRLVLVGFSRLFKAVELVGRIEQHRGDLAGLCAGQLAGLVGAQRPLSAPSRSCRS